MGYVYLVWLVPDDEASMLVGVADTKEKAEAMKEKLEGTDGFESCDYEIIEFKRNTVTIDDVDYTF